MPIYNGSTQITNIQVPAYTVSFWREATSSEITAAINSGYVKSETKGESPYSYTYYTIINTSNWRIKQQGSIGIEPVLETKITETKTEATEVFEKNGSTTTVCYCKRTFTIEEGFAYVIAGFLRYQRVYLDKGLPFDTTLYFSQGSGIGTSFIPDVIAHEEVLKAGETYKEYSLFSVNVPWVGSVEIDWYDGRCYLETFGNVGKTKTLY